MQAYWTLTRRELAGFFLSLGGYIIIAAALFLMFYMRAVGKIGWVTTLLVGIISPLSLYITFDKLFLIPLPQGLWGGYLLRF